MMGDSTSSAHMLLHVWSTVQYSTVAYSRRRFQNLGLNLQDHLITQRVCFESSVSERLIDRTRWGSWWHVSHIHSLMFIPSDLHYTSHHQKSHWSSGHPSHRFMDDFLVSSMSLSPQVKQQCMNIPRSRFPSLKQEIHGMILYQSRDVWVFEVPRSYLWRQWDGWIETSSGLSWF